MPTEIERAIADAMSHIECWDTRVAVILVNPKDVPHLPELEKCRASSRLEFNGMKVGVLWGATVIASDEVEAPEAIPAYGGVLGLVEQLRIAREPIPPKPPRPGVRLRAGVVPVLEHEEDPPPAVQQASLTGIVYGSDALRVAYQSLDSSVDVSN